MRCAEIRDWVDPRRSIFVVALAATLCGPAAAALAQAPAAPNPGDVDTARSRVYVFVGKSGLGHEHAVIGRLKSGHISLNSAENAGQLEFDMTTFVADTDEARKYIGLPGHTDPGTQRDVNANMLGDSVLNVRQFPTATFEIRAAKIIQPARQGAATEVELDGSLTLHGQTRGLKIRAAAEAIDSAIRLRGKFTLTQTHFGIHPYSKLLGTIGVADQLTVHGDIWLHNPPTAAR